MVFFLLLLLLQNRNCQMLLGRNLKSFLREIRYWIIKIKKA